LLTTSQPGLMIHMLARDFAFEVETGYPSAMAYDAEQEGPYVSIEQVIQTAVERMVKLAGILSTTAVPDDLDWFRKMLIGILTSTYRNYLAVQAGTPQSPDFACWGARKLLELRVITAYVLRSEDTAVDFMDDLAADTRELWENITKSAQFTHKELIAEMREAAVREPEPWGPLLLIKADEEEKKGPSTQRPATELENTGKMMELSASIRNEGPSKDRQSLSLSRKAGGMLRASRCFPRSCIRPRYPSPRPTSRAASTS
jgi:hypothetical protein